MTAMRLSNPRDLNEDRSEERLRGLSVSMVHDG